MTTYPFVIASAVFLFISLVFWVIRLYAAAAIKERSLVNRAVKWGGQGDAASSGPAPAVQGLAVRVLGALTLGVAPTASELEEVNTEIALCYQQAGIYNPKQVKLYQSVRTLFTVLPILGAVAFFLLTHRNVTPRSLFVILALIAYCYYLPLIWLKIKVHRRRRTFERYFPDATDLLVVCVEAGMGFDAAIYRVAKEMAITCPELAQEFKILSLELKTGKTRAECLKNLGRRVEISDVNNLINLVVQAEKFGTGVAKALRVHADEMRQKRFNRFEEEAAKLPVKLVFPLILFIFPSLFVVIMGPAAIQVYRNLIEK